QHATDHLFSKFYPKLFARITIGITMKKILFGIVCCLSIHHLSAQEDSTVVDLDEFTIKENRMEIPFSKISRNIHIIQRASIETTPARSLQEVLSFVPGVDVRQRGVSGTQANIGIDRKSVVQGKSGDQRGRRSRDKDR